MRKCRIKCITYALIIAGCSQINAQEWAPGHGPGESVASEPCTQGASTWYLNGNNVVVPGGLPPGSQIPTNLAVPDIGTCNDYPFVLKANNNRSVFILPSGRVGIGNPLPAAQLEVSAPGLSRVFNSSTGANSSSSFWAINASTSFGLENDGNNVGHIKQNYLSPVNMINFQSNQYSLSGASVWIGKKQVSGQHTDADFTVGGKMLAQEIYVSIQGTWADYVFSSDYKLPKLEDVEMFYKKNKHLPEIPSANEVTEKGIDLGEMNKVLLKKVEEITLYLVEQQKQIDLLKRKNEELRTIINADQNK